MTVEPRQPRVFSLDDPAIVPEPDAIPEARITDPEPETEDTRPTLADIRARGWRWGLLLAASLGGALALGLTAWSMRVVSAALARDDWLSTATVALLAIAGFAALMIALREILGFARLGSLKRLKQDAIAAIHAGDRAGEQRTAVRLVGLYANRRELVRGISLFREHTRDVHDPGELLPLFEREILTPLDSDARGLITRSAKRVATVAALSPMVMIAVIYVLIENLRLLRALATLYGARPGLVGALRLARLVFMHIVATGGIAMTDDLLGQFLGQDVLRRISRRLGEGAFNGALTARIGVAALDVIRPLPFLAVRAPRVRDILAEALRPLLPIGRSRVL